MKKLLIILSLCFTSSLFAAPALPIHISLTNDNLTPIGEVVFQDTPQGLLISPNLTNLPAGIHGFHLHEHADCSEHGMKAGGHFDPAHTNSHQGPYGHGHLGDLPALSVNEKGEATLPILAPRLKLSDLSHLAVMVHQDGDNYSDTPPQGGGGPRLACGLIP